MFFNYYKLVAQSNFCIAHEHLKNHQTSGIAKLGHTGAHDLTIRGHAHHLEARLKKLLALKVLLWTAKQALKMHEGLEIEQHNIAICILRITRPRMLPCSHWT